MMRHELLFISEMTKPGFADDGLLEWFRRAGMEFPLNEISPGVWVIDKAKMNKSIGDLIFYSQVVVVGVGTNIAIFPATMVVPTAGNIPQNFRAQYEHVYIKGIRLLQGANASLVATDWDAGLSNGELQNGRINININNVLQFTIPLTAFNDDGNPEEPGLVWLDHPIPWAGQTQIGGNLLFDVAPVTVSQNVRVELICSGLF